MRVSDILALDDVITSVSVSATHYTAVQLSDSLGLFDRLALEVVTDTVTGTPTLSVAIEHSGDGRNWIAKNGSAEIPTTTLSTIAPTVLAGGDTGASGTLAFVRLRLILTGTAVSAHVRIFVTGRDRLLNAPAADVGATNGREMWGPSATSYVPSAPAPASPFRPGGPGPVSGRLTGQGPTSITLSPSSLPGTRSSLR